MKNSKPRRRLRLTLSFDGEPYCGFQSQPNGPTVQAALEKALAQVTQQKAVVVGCSRTDAGVHARVYIAHTDTLSTLPVERLRAALNSLLPATIAVHDVADVKPRFHAQRSVKRKTYRYVILNAPVRDPLSRGRAWHLYENLNVGAMRAAGRALQGTHDFSCFQASDPLPRPARRKLLRCAVSARQLPPPMQGREITIDVEAPGFLKYMVRNIVGTLVEVGRGKRARNSMAKLLRSKDRKLAGPTAPAHGLTLHDLRY